MRESRMYRDSRARECFVRKKWLVVQFGHLLVPKS